MKRTVSQGDVYPGIIVQWVTYSEPTNDACQLVKRLNDLLRGGSCDWTGQCEGCRPESNDGCCKKYYFQDDKMLEDVVRELGGVSLLVYSHALNLPSSEGQSDSEELCPRCRAIQQCLNEKKLPR